MGWGGWGGMLRNSCFSVLAEQQSMPWTLSTHPPTHPHTPPPAARPPLAVVGRRLQHVCPACPGPDVLKVGQVVGQPLGQAQAQVRVHHIHARKALPAGGGAGQHWQHGQVVAVGEVAAQVRACRICAHLQHAPTSVHAYPHVHLTQPDMARGKSLRSLQRSTMRVAYMMGLNWGRGRRSICPNSTSASSGSNSKGSGRPGGRWGGARAGRVRVAGPHQTCWLIRRHTPPLQCCWALCSSYRRSYPCTPTPTPGPIPAVPLHPAGTLTSRQAAGALHSVGLKVEAGVQHVLLRHQAVNQRAVALRGRG